LEDNLIILIIIILHAIGVLIYKYYRPRIEGAKGEYRIAKLLRKLKKDKYKVLNDIYLEVNGKSSQIDHLIISIYGIFVIETKNYQGWIHGSQNSENWTQSIYKKKIKFRNPIKQNWSHIYTLKDILKEFDFIEYHPIVVFAGKATLKNIHSNVPVVYKYELLETIKKYDEFNLSSEEVEDIFNQIHEFEIKENKKRKHKKYVKQNIRNRKRSVKSLICPNCNGMLKVKNGRFGDFYGCSNFPNCKYSKKI